MKERLGLKNRIKYFGGMILCVILSICVLMFGEHDSRDSEAEGLMVPLSAEAEDGDLDFGNVGSDDLKNELHAQGTVTSVPTATPVVSQTGSGTEEDPLILEDAQFSYAVVNGKASVTQVLDENAVELTVPAAIQGYPVTVIGEYLCQDMSGLKAISLPEGLEEISYNAFENCSGLEEIIFPSTLTTIRDSAFFACNGLTKVALPKKLTNLEDYAFFGCDNLTELSLYRTSGLDMVFDMETITKVTVMEGATDIAESAFEYCSNLKEISLPSSLSTIRAYAFYDCVSLESIVIPQGVVSIGEDAFEGCTALRDVVLPEGLLLIAEYAFYGCEALETLTLPDSITSIGDSAFDECANLVLWVGAESVGEEYVMGNDLLYEVKQSQ